MVTGCGMDVSLAPDASNAAGDGSGATIAGTITVDQTWSGANTVTAATTIASGVTVTVAAGARITVAPGASITVAGKVDIAGTRAATVVMKPLTNGGSWGGFVVAGELVMHYGDQTGGGIVVDGGMVTVIDTVMSHYNDGRDFLIVHSGHLDVEYSSIGSAPGVTDVDHCDLHANQGGTSTIKVIHTNLSSATYGFDFFGGTADLTYDNWFSNATDLYTEPGAPVIGDVSFGWFKNGPPTAAPGSMITANALSPTKLTAAGPRP